MFESVINFILGRRISLQHNILLCEDRTIDFPKYPIDTGTMSNKEGMKTYYLVHSVLMPMEGERDLYAIIDERNAMPHDPFNRLTAKERKRCADVRPIARESFRREMQIAQNKNTTNWIQTGIGFGIIAFVILVAIILLLALTENFSNINIF